ncbi:hypothetical protein ERX37_05125 [Macrococcus hajekii]|uniref:Uncharacterized protein n=1 Tax=Macrococcus hajekii TaxID=198482 RepID=A0A4R6BP78_9STAP|nr:hypothetical protein [Macrococcus hajekii]TDM03467.1 hypothetical protein ERX37_05125 [Macrococcus hajekii]GGA99123.1 hypothetical protein GCM10007190_03920 [Macrococcus hajekii]
MMEFLYFPENKMEYIPAVITLAIFMLLAYLTFRFFKNHASKEEEKMEAFEQDVLRRLEDKELKNERSL